MTEKHKLIVEFFVSRTGFVATCSCGKKLRRAMGCNRAGIDYAWLGVRDDYIAHLEEVVRQ